jgi:ankyrin repeat protein
MLAPLPAYILASARNETPLHVAAEEGHLEIVKVLIDHGADINAKNYHGETPLMLAFRHLDDPVTEYVTSGFPTGTKWFMKHQSEETIKLLLERGADVNVTSKSPGQVTPLHQAVYRGNKELTKLILDRGGNINAPDHVGDTPLHYAVRGSLVRTGSKFKIETDKELVKLLLDRGADVNAQGFWKETPLKIAKNKEIKELLQQYGAK